VFDLSYLGHQGWFVRAGDSTIAIDPALTETLLGAPDDAIALHPPRDVDFAALPPIDAIVISHEHPDHLHLPTLARLASGTPVYLPERSSSAARDILVELGLEPRALTPLARHEIGAIVVEPFHGTELTRDEWDVLPLLVRDQRGHGSFATSIDAPETGAFARFVLERCPRPGVYTSSHNHFERGPLTNGAAPRPMEVVVAELAREMGRRFVSSFEPGRCPVVLSVHGTGFAFRGELAWLHEQLMPPEASAIAAALGRALRGVRVVAPEPGTRFSFEAGLLRDVADGLDGLALVPRSRWPRLGSVPFRPPPPELCSATSTVALDAAEDAELARRLDELARDLYGGELMTALYRSASVDRGAAFVLRDGEAFRAFAYAPQRCAFEAVNLEQGRAAATWLECHARDLLAVLRCELPAGYLLLGRSRTWYRDPALADVGLDEALVRHTHPLRRPADVLAQYRATVARCRPHGGEARWRRGGASA
jgi:hypothetical protein